MSSNQGATFQGYVHSTRDALLIFEAVRRGILPKITRRLRDDERKQIASGTIFVFDEVESSIKRWTDGMIWSPSRILNNFLVYREVEKKDPKPAPDQPALATSHSNYSLSGVPLNNTGSSNTALHNPVRSVPLTLMPTGMEPDSQMVHYKQEHNSYHTLDSVASSSDAVYPDQDGFFDHQTHPQHSSHIQTHAQAAGLVGMMHNNAASSSTVKREADLDRTIVGSLTSSYPFVRDGLCKKTISIQVEGSTQHLISYYKIDDVHNSRLAVPSSLPEIASLSISPIFLNKSNFRYPPIVEIGPDGTPRYVGESTDNAMRASGHVSSGNESYSSSEARHDALGRAANRSLSIYSPGLPSDPSHVELHGYRYPHQIGGDGMLPASATLPPSSSPYRNRRSSDAPRRRANSRYEPYQQPAPFGHSMQPHQLYSSTGLPDNGAISPSGRRPFLGGMRSYGEGDAASAWPPEQGAFAVQRQQEDGFFGMENVGLASGANGGSHAPHIDQHASFQQPFQSGSMMPVVPSQPGRSNASYSTDFRSEHCAGMKHEQGDPFHFSSSRLTRGSWDSNQPSHSSSFLHNLQQPPATSQGLVAMSMQSQSSFGPPFYPRLAGSPPNTGSSYDSRHSYFGSNAAHAPGRIEEVIDGVHAPTATRLEDPSYSSRPISRAGEGGYAGELDTADVVKTGGLEALRVHSGPASPYPRAQQQQQHQQIPSMGGPGYDAYGRPSSAVEGQSFYVQQTTHAATEHEGVQLNQNAAGRHIPAYVTPEAGNAPAQTEEAWSSTPAVDVNGTTNASQGLSTRPGASHDQGFQPPFPADASDASAAENTGLERVMLTRPAP
ncbi:hypothetical protein EX895_003245 [Sporisorium graminicola]|uniref:cAMP-independent regulatory protein pac2 n=1 Tax=Sporisorium graminicola TaxID=280036 RepID=A0A4U7KT13_9BASI|nr:hypothetical protein EX895_003245 [Sporisorium graminicola]TKY87664.1 hypothetical protein EX895_003245 [Sporisorium graminicola]